ncbi:MAG TPA: hypothetical protein DCZ00_01295 [Lactococcus sp.]|nr:hypothetical protein [Lactococcus sp.]
MFGARKREEQRHKEQMKQLEDKYIKVEEREIQQTVEIQKKSLLLIEQFLQITEKDSKNLMDCMNRRLGVLLQMVYWSNCPGSNMLRYLKIQKILQKECRIQEVQNDM